MKLKDLKVGQQFKFVTGTDKIKYKIVSEYPRVIYGAINGYVEHEVNYNSRLNREVELLNQPNKETVLAYVPTGNSFWFGEVRFKKLGEPHDDTDGMIHCEIYGQQKSVYITSCAWVRYDI